MAYLTRLAEYRDALYRRAADFSQQIDGDERKRLLSHAFALTTVAVAAAFNSALAGAHAAAPFLLFQAAVAITATQTDFAAASVATLASLLAVRLVSGVDLVTGLLFSAEALLISVLIVRIRRMLEKERQRTAAADDWIRALKATERQARVVDRALDRLDEVSTDAVIVVLDSAGRIVDWRAGAARTYGIERDAVVGHSAAGLFEPPLSDAEFDRLLTESTHAQARRVGHHRRADGSPFTADVEMKPLSRGGLDGFTMIVRDLTRQEAWDAFAASATDAHARLRSEADIAQHQLATLQNITDPSLNLLDTPDVIRTLLNRLRDAIDAEGIALVHTGRFQRRVYCAAAGLQCRRGTQRAQAQSRDDDPGRALIIHNDAASVAEMSAVEWPDGVSSLIAVPVVCAGSKQAVIEVVSARRRHSTEWEIALVQVVAARLAGLLRDDPYADAGAA